MGVIKIRNSSFGIGDMVCGLYAVQALKNKYRDQQVIYCVRKPEWFNLLQEISVVDYIKAAVVPHAEIDIYVPLAREAANGRLSRKELYAQQIHLLNLEPVKPVIRNIDNKEFYNTITIFPFAAWKDREWPLEKWLYLEAMLLEAGHSVVIISEASRVHDTRFFKSPVLFGLTPAEVTDRVINSKAIVGNDSGMVHLAGMYGVPAYGINHFYTERFLYSHTGSKLIGTGAASLHNIEVEMVFNAIKGQVPVMKKTKRLFVETDLILS